MKSETKQLPIIAALVMVVSFMSAYEIFYGSVKSPMWYVLYYGKYYLVVVYAVFTYMLQDKKDKEAAVVRKKYSQLFLIVPLVIFLYSVLIWLIERPSSDFITRGISNTVFRCISYVGGIAIALSLKKDAPRYGIYAALITYGIGLLLGICNEGWDFFTTALFFRQTSAQGTYTELHELAFVIGLYLIFLFFINNKKFISNPKPLMILCCICFIIGWKRIGIGALFVVTVYMICCKLIQKKNINMTLAIRNRKVTFDIMKITEIAAVIGCVLYVALTTSNELVSSVEAGGVNLMGRNIIYNYFRRFYDFSVGFFGHGVGFVSRQFDYATPADLYNMISIKALHNDLMRVFIEIGFLGFVIWCCYWLVGVPRCIEKIAGKESAFVCLCLILYSFITYTTDNTEGYFNFQMHLVMLITSITYYYCLTKGGSKRLNE